MHHRTSQIHEGMKTQCLHGFRSIKKREVYFKEAITSLKKIFAVLNRFFFFFSLKIEF